MKTQLLIGICLAIASLLLATPSYILVRKLKSQEMVESLPMKAFYPAAITHQDLSSKMRLKYGQPAHGCGSVPSAYAHKFAMESGSSTAEELYALVADSSKCSVGTKVMNAWRASYAAIIIHPEDDNEEFRRWFEKEREQLEKYSVPISVFIVSREHGLLIKDKFVYPKRFAIKYVPVGSFAISCVITFFLILLLRIAYGFYVGYQKFKRAMVEQAEFNETCIKWETQWTRERDSKRQTETEVDLRRNVENATMHIQRNCELLGMEKFGSQREIQRAFRNLLRLVHPDLNPMASPEYRMQLIEKTRKLLEAREELFLVERF